MIEPLEGIGPKLNALLVEAGQSPLSRDTARDFETYFELLRRWNERINLTAIRTEGEILRRHFVESIAVARALPFGIGTLLDFGSGAGFPGIPIAIVRPEIAVVLAESQVKKAAFLREAARSLNVPVEIFAGRAETIVRKFHCVTLRAVDRMQEAVTAAASLVAPGGWLALLVTEATAEDLARPAGPGFRWRKPVRLPSADSRIIFLGLKDPVTQTSPSI